MPKGPGGPSARLCSRVRLNGTEPGRVSPLPGVRKIPAAERGRPSLLHGMRSNTGEPGIPLLPSCVPVDSRCG